MHQKLTHALSFLLSIVTAPALSLADTAMMEADDEIYTLPSLTVRGQETANVLPASTFESVVSNLDFDPRIDFQSRNMAEAQGDVSIRGGIFEGTGIQVGAASLLDPQTGHYTTELPIAPEMLGESTVYTGSDNALYGFNSTAGTLVYQWSKIREGGSLSIGGGENELNFQRLHTASVQALEAKSGWTLGYEAEYSRSESDGTVAYSDHDFDRVTGRVQLLGPNSQTDFFAGYQSKFFGQFGMYTGDQYTAFNPYETENIKTRLFVLNHRQEYASSSNWEATAYYRKNSDHYIFNRFQPNNTFIHETDVYAIGVSGQHEMESAFAVNYSLQLARDSIESNTLEAGKFTSRSYYKLSLVPQYRYAVDDQQSLVLRGGFSFDDTNRNDSKISPILEISLLNDQGQGSTDRVYLSYAESTQVVGYGAIGGSETSGLFRSKHDLLRETSQNLELGYRINRAQWSVESAIFYRSDEDLVDWTYSGAGARSAENVDIETFGFEIIGARYWDKLEAIASYSHLQKSEDYGNPAVIGSFYALNFPKHRATLGLIYTPNDFFEIRLDNEWRDQERNALRSGSDDALFSYLGISYYPDQSKDFELFLAFDKVWEDGFQEIPGTPGRGDQASVGLCHKW